MTGRQEDGTTAAEVAFAWTSLEGALISAEGADAQFPAASTMKLVVLIAVYRQLDLGCLSVDQKVQVTSQFHSAAGRELFEIPIDEVDSDLATLRDLHVPVADLIERMITVSSNDATNLLLELVGLAPLKTVLSDLGATGSCVRRPIGDRPAEAQGLANLVTPLDLCRLLSGIATGRAASSASCAQMLAVLGRQQYRDEIPAGIPSEARTANKNGWDRGIRHDAALVWPPDTPGYCLAVCTRGFISDEDAKAAIRERSRKCYSRRHVLGARAGWQPRPDRPGHF